MKKILVACDLVRAIAIAFVPLLLVHFGVAALFVAIAFIAVYKSFGGTLPPLQMQ